MQLDIHAHYKLLRFERKFIFDRFSKNTEINYLMKIRKVGVVFHTN